MANIQVVIRISENTINEIKDNAMFAKDIADNIKWDVTSAIVNGTQLPEEHGELVDRDAINERFDGIWDELHSYSNQPTYKELLDKLSMCLNTAEPIIKDNYD